MSWEDGNETFISIEDSAQRLIDYIDNSYCGKVYAIGGLSIGAQIVTEILSIRENIVLKSISFTFYRQKEETGN